MTANGQTSGRLLRRALIPSRLFEFETDFFRLLREVQSTTDLFDKTVDVEAVYGILRSSRHGMTAHARNVGITKDELNTFNRWSADMNSYTGG